MSATTLTTVLSIVLGVVGSVSFPLWLTRRKKNSDQDAADVASWQGLNSALQTEVTRLNQKLDATVLRHRQEIADLTADFERKQAEATRQIADLQTRVQVLTEAIRGRQS